MTSPAILLHTPQLGENIGSAARVMLNFGLTDLRLITPRDGWPNPASEPLSAGAFERGVDARVFETLEDAMEGLTYVAAATARPRGLQKDVLSASQTVEVIQTRMDEGKGQAGVLFGGESSGLPNEAVAVSDVIMTYPVNADFSSLNLSMAVGVFCHIWGEALDEQADLSRTSLVGGVDAPASRSDLYRMFEHLETELDRAGYFYPPDKTPLMKDNLRAAFIRGDWTHQEVQTFRGAIKALALGRGKARVTRDD